MSDNGPHNQPPQSPYGGGEYGEGQPPYGPPQGGDPSGAQPGGVPGYGTGAQPGFGTGGQPGFGPGGQPPYGPGPQGQPMYGGGQPPYGPAGPAGPGQAPQPPRGNGGNKAGLWVVLGGGAVIVVLVVAVIVTLINNNSEPDAEITVADAPSESTDDGAEETDGSEGDGEGGAPSGEPPYDVPSEPCDAFTDQVESDFLLTEEGYKSVQDNTSSCSSSLADPPEGNDADAYGSFEISYTAPYSNGESEAEAGVDYERAVDEVTGQSEYGLFLDEVMEESEVDLGDEAYYVVNGYDFVGDEIPKAVLLIRTANLNIRIEYQLHGPFDQQLDLDELVMPDDVQEMMHSAGEDALAQVG